ncbi:MAG: response regulator transcription factor [Chloroflexota bacterium]
MATEMIHILVVYEDPLVRKVIHAILSNAPNIQVVAEINHKENVGEFIERLHPNLILMEAKWLAFLNGLNKENMNREETFLLGIFCSNLNLPAVFIIKFNGQLLESEELIDAIRYVTLAGEVSTGERTKSLSRCVLSEKDMQNLSPREKEVLNLLIQGFANKAISHELAISIKTTEFHISNIINKLEVRSSREVVARIMNYQ